MNERRRFLRVVIPLVALFFALCGATGTTLINSLLGVPALTFGWGLLSALCLLPFVLVPLDRGYSLTYVINRLPQPLLQGLLSWNLSQIILTFLSIGLFFLPRGREIYDGIPLFVVIAVTITVFRSAARVTHKEVTVEFGHLPQSWTDLTILHISDIHAGPFMRRGRLKKIIERINGRIMADICVITGDVVNHSAHELHWALPILETIKTRRGIFSTLGNHEYIDDEQMIIKSYLKSSVKLLLKSSVVVSTGSGAVRLIGVDYPFESGITMREEIDAALKDSGNSKQEILRILLSHHPNGFKAARQTGVHLTLSGHTHGGQIRLFGKNLIGRFVRYTRGLYKEGSHFLYVSSGMGNWLPFRINCPCEYAVIRVVRKSAKVL